jgi:hypothetical protein
MTTGVTGISLVLDVSTLVGFVPGIEGLRTVLSVDGDGIPGTAVVVAGIKESPVGDFLKNYRGKEVEGKGICTVCLESFFQELSKFVDRSSISGSQNMCRLFGN